MSRHNRERKKNRPRATQSTPTGINRPNPGPAPTYRDDNRKPFIGDQNGREEPAVRGEKPFIVELIEGLIAAGPNPGGFRGSSKRR